MHSISFQLKRAHLSAVGFGRTMVASVKGMTPARFDLLYLVRRWAIIDAAERRDPLAPTLSQPELTKSLGLHRTTVSRMLRQLVEMGWVHRRRSEWDRRTFNVGLTALGLRRIWEAMRRVFRPRRLRRLYEEHFRPVAPRGYDVVGVIRGVIRTIQGIARRFGDTSSVWYDFGGGVPNRQLWPEEHLVPLSRRS